MKYLIVIIVVLTNLTVVNANGANQKKNAEQRGLEIAREMDRRDTGWIDQRVDAKMILHSADGREVARNIKTRSVEVAGDGDRSIVVFEQPRDIKGTSFLTYTHKSGNDDQWLYMPALKRVKRISSSNRSGPFMGSEFSYEDMSSEEVERYRYHYVGTELCGGKLACFVIERYPVDHSSGYTKQRVWIDREHYRIHKIDYYDRKDALLKTVHRSGYHQYLDTYWRAALWNMTNHQTGKRTVVKWGDYEFQTGLSVADFSRTALKRLR